jgi:uncharacterized protein
MSTLWDFFQNQILGMKWLNALIGRALTALGLDLGSRWGGSVQFFLYDMIKILILLSILIFSISYVQSYFPPERTRRILSRFRGLTANLLAALLGTVTPFCSCSSIPLFIGFSSAGLPVGITFSFLISSPLVDLGSLILLMSVFGAKVAIAYVLVGLILAVLGGLLIDRLGMERYVASFVKEAGQVEFAASEPSRRERVAFAAEQLKTTLHKVILYILGGVALGALIHNWLPAAWIQTVLGSRNPFSVILATIIGVPMYADIFGAIPVAEALFFKGVGLGTVLAFMMAVTALSAPSLILLSRAVKPRLLAVFTAIVTVGIIIIGYLFNALQHLLV